MIKGNIRASLLVIAALTAMPAMAQSSSLEDSLYAAYFNLNDVVVVGTRTPKLLKDTPIQTRLITSSDIEKSDATNIEDLLQQEMPGIEFSYSMNQQVHLNFSGFGGQGILFLVDGERLAGETMEDVDFTRLNLDNVDHIEIIKGAASALYGSNACGGVINIITKEAKKAWTLNVNGRLARHNEQRYGGFLGLSNKVLSNMLSVNHTTTDNYDVHSADNPATRVVSTIYGGLTWNVKDQLTYKPADNLKIVGRAGYFFRQLTRTADTPERYRDFSAGLRGIWDISQNDNVEVSYSFDQYDKSNLYRITSLDIRKYSNVQNIFRGLYNHSWDNGNILTVGADYMHDYLMNTNLEGNSRKQDTFDAFTQFDWVLTPQWEIVSALRYDYFSDGSNSRVTPKITARFQPQRNLNIRFGYGMGFRAPTLKEKYYNFDMAGIWTVNGNPDLKAELSHNFNLSADYTKGHFNFTLSTYYNSIENKLTTGLPYYQPGDDKQLYLDYINLDNYSICGGEATVQAHWNNGISGRLSYSYTHEHLAHDKDGNTINNQYIPARKHSLTARIDWEKQISRNYGILLSVNGRFLSGVDNMEYADYYDISKGSVRVSYPAYTLWKLSFVQRFGKAIRLTAAVDNIFNYKPKYYYLNCPLTDGANFMVGLNIDVDKLF